MSNKKRWLVGVVLGWLLVMPPAQAQWAVIDVAAVQQLFVQVSYWKQQIVGMQNQLNQLKQTHSALTGGRGMQALVPTSEAQRNYLPQDWTDMLKVLDGGGGQYSALTDAVVAAMQARAVLDDARLAGLGQAERDSVMHARQSASAALVMTERASQNAAQRFAALQALVTAVGNAPDAKAIADLQARIAAEEAMLSNEQAKLATLFQAAQAEQWAQAAQLREAAIAGHGQFEDRLHPTLPQ